jgi:deoxyribodipyrimidine photo-lyase
MPKRIIYWFRNDLRLHDNEGFLKATQDADEVIPIYVFDTRQFKEIEPLGFPKTGAFRAKFLLESVQNLRDNLRKKGSNLLVRLGKPEVIHQRTGERVGRIDHLYKPRKQPRKKLILRPLCQKS